MSFETGRNGAGELERPTLLLMGTSAAFSGTLTRQY
jgi:hypothetical protein